MATLKYEVGHLKKDNTYPVIIRITHKRVVRRVRLGIYVDAGYVTQGGKIKDQSVIALCEQTINAWRRKLIDIAGQLDNLTADDIVNYLTKKQENKQKILFFEYGWKEVEKLKASGRNGTATNRANSLRSLMKFTNKDDLSTDDITADLLRSWLDEVAKTTTRAASLYYANLKTLWNKMRQEYNDEDKSVMPIPHNPFARVIPPKEPAYHKRALTVEQIRAIITFPKQENHNQQKSFFNIVNLARDMFAISFLMLGMNLADIWECGKPNGEYLTYKRKKTRSRRKDEAEMTIKIQPEAKMFIEKYVDPLGERLFCFQHHYSEIKSFEGAVNHGLKVIGKAIGIPNLTHYSARHSWATIAVNECKVDKYTVHLALNHVDRATAITDVYIKKDWSIIDDANRKVIDFIAGKY